MNRMSVFNSPFLLGFDQFERTIDRISKLSSDSYPPYNIEQTSPNSIRITIAVAGFNKKDLDISLEGNQLQIRGSRDDNEVDRIYIHRGIATRQFQRNFILAEGIEVEEASMDNGLLFIDLSQPINNEESKKIEIRDKNNKIKENLISLGKGKWEAKLIQIIWTSLRKFITQSNDYLEEIAEEIDARIKRELEEN